MNVVELKNVSKTFKKNNAVNNVSFSIEPGKIVSILGPNGAGKTTTISMMLGLLDTSGGTVKLFGQDLKEIKVRERIGAMPQELSVLDGLKVGEVLDLFCSYYPNPLHKNDLIKLVGLENETKKRADKLSGGQKRRLSFALAVAGDPDLLFLDEPTVGMDITSRRKFWETIHSFSLKGKTIVFTTHYLQEADDMADRIILFNNGEIVADGTPAEVKSVLTSQSVSFRSADEQISGYLITLPQVKSVYREGERIFVETDDTDFILETIFTEGFKVNDIQIDQGRLDKAFEQLTI
ncbi:ABC transporter ATP-binding protein [Bacillus gobiensis]|uniref:ABC transporter ATP-binding protein n=1 Tax=Bacillus gobiensis TaxID=1441095 RepID=UPI003D245D09